MLGRVLVHLPWVSAVFLLVVLFSVESLILQPRQTEGARVAAIETIRARLARDLGFIQTRIGDGAVDEVKEFISASSAMPGLEDMVLIEPGGTIVASPELGLESEPMTSQPEYGALKSILGRQFAPEIHRKSNRNIVEAIASVPFPDAQDQLRSVTHGILYQRWDLGPVVAPVVESTRGLTVLVAVLLIVIALPSQWMVYYFLMRRLQHLAEDVARFGRGVRTNLFADERPDQIGAISGLLREATRGVAEREESAQRLELALESANAGIWDWNITEGTIQTNAQYHMMLGDEAVDGPISAEELLARVHPDDLPTVRAGIRVAFKREVALYDAEFRMSSRRGDHYTWIRSTGRVVEWNSSGMATRMLGQHADISAQYAVQTHKADLASIVDDSLNEIYVFSTETLCFLTVNASASANLGYSRKSLLGMTPMDVLPEIEHDDFRETLDSLRQGHVLSARHVTRHQRADGTTYDVDSSIQLQSYNEESAFVSIVQDITEQVRQQEALAISEGRNLLQQRRFQKLFDGVSHAIIVFDRDVRFIMANVLSARVLNVSPESLVGRSLQEFLPEIFASSKERIAMVLDTRNPAEFEEEIPIGGKRRWFHTVWQPLEDDAGDLSWVQVVANETTEKKRNEARIQAQQERYRTLVESTSAILWEGDPATFNFSFVNREAEKVLGYPAQQWIDEPNFWANHVHPADREWATDYCKAATEERREHTFEYRMIAKDGRIVWLRDIVSVLQENGRPTRLVGVMIDISRERRQEERFQAAFESIPIGNIVIDECGIIQLANPAAQEMFGFTQEEMAGQNVSMLMPEPDHGQHDAYLSKYIETGVPKLLGSSREVRGLRKNGETFPVRLAVGEMRDDDHHRTFVGSVIDLSHVKSLEAQLAQSQKMEAIGQLAGGIAHDFNNLLHVINGFVEIAQTSLPEEAPVQMELSQIAMAGQRAAALTGQLLAFSRRQVMEPGNLDVNAVISSLGNMLARVIGEHIQLDVMASPRLARVYADRGMLEQILMNLCVNARDAMPQGGRLSIETENVVITDEYCHDHVWARPGRYVLISVTDTGCGIPPETIGHIFEPFYTTKAVHAGTGLGLSMVYGIVKQHDGMINVYSEVAKGTTFKVYLPHSERAAEDVGTKIEGEVPRGTETILVVEDDASVRGLTRRVLEAAGYTVLDAEDGLSAIRCFESNQDRVHLALLDVVMPGMGGREAYEAMLKIDPHLKALFASGYSENAIHTNFVLDSGLSLLKKPYSRDDLLRSVRRILDQ